MVRRTRSASLRLIGMPGKVSKSLGDMKTIKKRISSFKHERTEKIEGEKQTLTTDFTVRRLWRRKDYARKGSYPQISGVFMKDYIIEVETRDREKPRKMVVVSRSPFLFRPETGVAIYLGYSAGADDFASALAKALLDDSEDFTSLELSSDELKKVRQRASNIRHVGYRNNPDPNIRKMAYGGTHVDHSADVKRADRNAELYRIIVEILTSEGKRTIQVMGSGGILGYGVETKEIEDVTDIIEEILFGP